MLLTACNYYQLQSTSRRFKENCSRGKLPPGPNSNANPKPNPDPDRGAIFLGGNFPDTPQGMFKNVPHFKTKCGNKNASKTFAER